MLEEHLSVEHGDAPPVASHGYFHRSRDGPATVQHVISLQLMVIYTVHNVITLYNMVLNYTARYYIVKHCITLCSIALHCVA